MCPLLLSDFNQTWDLSANFNKIRRINLFEKPLKGFLGVTYIFTDGRTERVCCEANTSISVNFHWHYSSLLVPGRVLDTALDLLNHAHWMQVSG
jgi:hypothetical protein